MERKKMPEMLTRAQLAEYLQVSARTIRHYEQRSLLHPVAICRKKYYYQSEIDQVLTKK